SYSELVWKIVTGQSARRGRAATGTWLCEAAAAGGAAWPGGWDWNAPRAPSGTKRPFRRAAAAACFTAAGTGLAGFFAGFGAASTVPAARPTMSSGRLRQATASETLRLTASDLKTS